MRGPPRPAQWGAPRGATNRRLPARPGGSPMPQQWSMYVPAHFAETDPEKLAAVIGDYNFGILVSAGPQGLFATHLPFVPDPARPRELLHAHMARANPHW